MFQFVLNDVILVLYFTTENFKSFETRGFYSESSNACENPSLSVRVFGTCFVFSEEAGAVQRPEPARFLHLFKFGLVV